MAKQAEDESVHRIGLHGYYIVELIKEIAKIGRICYFVFIFQGGGVSFLNLYVWV